MPPQRRIPESIHPCKRTRCLFGQVTGVRGKRGPREAQRTMRRAEHAPRGLCLSGPVGKKRFQAPHQGIQDLLSQRFSGPPLGAPHPPCTVRAPCLQWRREKRKLRSQSRVEAARSQLRPGTSASQGKVWSAVHCPHPKCARHAPHLRDGEGWGFLPTQHRKLDRNRPRMAITPCSFCVE